MKILKGFLSKLWDNLNAQSREGRFSKTLGYKLELLSRQHLSWIWNLNFKPSSTRWETKFTLPFHSQHLFHSCSLWNLFCTLFMAHWNSLNNKLLFHGPFFRSSFGPNIQLPSAIAIVIYGNFSLLNYKFIAALSNQH